MVLTSAQQSKRRPIQTHIGQDYVIVDEVRKGGDEDFWAHPKTSILMRGCRESFLHEVEGAVYVHDGATGVVVHVLETEYQEACNKHEPDRIIAGCEEHPDPLHSLVILLKGILTMRGGLEAGNI